MVRIIYGKKGMGKTKVLIDTANSMASESAGDVVFIDDSNQLMYDLNHKVRFVNVSEFPLTCSVGFLGFICGIISEDYDIEGIFIDGLTYILKDKLENLGNFFKEIKKISDKYNVKFYISVNGDEETAPDFMREFIA